PRHIRVCRGHDHRLPARLAVRDNRGLARIWMAAGDLPHEFGLRGPDILRGLARHGLGREPDEVAWMTGLQRNADLAVLLHPADAGTMARPRVDNDERPLGRVCLNAFERLHANETVIDGARQRPAVEDYLSSELEDVRNLLGLLFPIDIPALPQDVEKEHGALIGVPKVVVCRPEILLFAHPGRLPQFRRARISSRHPRAIGISPDAAINLDTGSRKRALSNRMSTSWGLALMVARRAVPILAARYEHGGMWAIQPRSLTNVQPGDGSISEGQHMDSETFEPDEFTLPELDYSEP